MKLNCDLGESFGVWKMGMDEAVMPLIDQANIACGFHASDPLTMLKTVELACKHDVEIGAHPAYPDLVGFGRRSMSCSADELKALIWYQMGALNSICEALGTHIQYVKPHGAMNNDMMKSNEMLRTIMEAVAKHEGIALMLPVTMAHADHNAMANDIGLPIIFEAFADRAYTDEGQLVSRAIPGSVYHEPSEVIAQAQSFANKSGVHSINGKWLDLPIDSLCIHGDNEASIAVVKAIRDALGNQS
jgi:UPF0271 protein